MDQAGLGLGRLCVLVLVLTSTFISGAHEESESVAVHDLPGGPLRISDKHLKLQRVSPGRSVRSGLPPDGREDAREDGAGAGRAGVRSEAGRDEPRQFLVRVASRDQLSTTRELLRGACGARSVQYVPDDSFLADISPRAAEELAARAGVSVFHVPPELKQAAGTVLPRVAVCLWVGNSVGNSDVVGNSDDWYRDRPCGSDLYRGNTGSKACSTHAPGMRPGILTLLASGPKGLRLDGLIHVIPATT